MRVRHGWCVALALLPGVAPAQDLTEVDHIVAIVGRVAIPASRVEEQLNVMRQQGQPLPSDSAGLAKVRVDIVQRLVEDELLLQEAQADTSLHVTDEQVQNAVDQAIRKVRDQFPSEVDFQRQLQASGFGTQDEYRRWIADQQRRDLLQGALMQKLRQKGVLRTIPPTDDEMRAYYDKVKEGRTRPAVVSFRQIVMRPRPDSAAVASAFRLADSLSVAIKNGADFAALAKRFSEDPGTKDQGGELGYFRRGQMLPAFDYVAFTLRPGQTSTPVETPFGFHVIQVERSDPAEVQARHILIVPKITDANVAAAQALADTVATLARRGASFDSLARAHHDPSEEAFAQSVVMDSLPPVYRGAFATAKAGDIVGSLTLERPNGTRFGVVRVEETRPAGTYTYEEMKDQIRETLEQSSAVERYVAGLRKRTYVDIRP